MRNALAVAIHKFFQERGFLYVHTPIISASDAEGAGRCSRSPRSIWNARRSGKPRRFHAGFLRQAHLPDGQRPARSRDLRARLRQRLHLRPDVPRRELEHAAPPGRVLDDRAGDGVLRPERQSGPGRGVPEEPGGAGAGRLPRRPGVLQQVVRHRVARDAGRPASPASFERITYTEAIATAAEVRQELRVSRPSGASTCRASTSAT